MTIEKQMVQWYDKNKRDFPFRQTKDPYKIWVSEIMSQQTQMSRVVDYYIRFLETFPNVEALANANEEQLLKAWEGLGYYSRARNMQVAARYIVEENEGVFPKTYQDLLSLKGVGVYTAAAIASISFDEKVAAVDGNVLRVFARLTLMDDDILLQKTKNKVMEIMNTWMDEDPLRFNQSFIELGATICTPTKPRCHECPLSEMCLARQTGTIVKYPVKIKKVKQAVEQYNTFIVQDENGRVLLLKQNRAFLGGMYLLPQYTDQEDLPQSIRELETLLGIKIQEESLIHAGNFKHVFSHKIWEMNVFFLHVPVKNKTHFLTVKNVPVANAHGNILDKIFNE